MKKGIRHGPTAKPVYRESYLMSGRRGLHRVLAEAHLGRRLAPGEVVHHVNGNKLDNRIDNLLVVTRAWHKKIHGDIGSRTRFKRLYSFTDSEALSCFLKHRSAIKAAAELGCSEVTVRRAVKRLTGKLADEIAKENNWGRRSARWV